MNLLQDTVLVILFLATAGFSFGVISLWRPRPRLTSQSQASPHDASQPSPANEAWLARLSALAKPLAKLALPNDGWDTSAMRIRFLNAGLRHAAWPTIYFGTKAVLALLLPLILLFVVGIGSQLGNDLGIASGGRLFAKHGSKPILVALLALASIGYYLPNVLLSLRIRNHRRELFEAFPDAIDLIIVCIEAGLGLDAAIARTAEELRLRSPALADELHLVGLELRIGASRTQALRNLALRTGLDEASALVAMLLQADRFGSSIADSLRVHADALRTRRRMLAEEAAAKIPLKLLFPLIFCIFPSLILVLMGPATISIYRLFLKNVVGH